MRAESGQILIFGGTTEGRKAAELLLKEGVPCTVSVATQYGGEVLQPHPRMTVHIGRLDRVGMARMMREGHYRCVIDATHPYARIVSEEIKAACRGTGLPYLRLIREKTGSGNPDRDPGDGTCVYVNNVAQAGAYLASVPGRILVTTGSRELARFTKALGDPARITARVLPAQESLRACAEAGLAGKQIIAMQGPFDIEMNCAHIRWADASWIVTKETGTAGGYPGKIEAARKCGIRAVVIRIPPDREHTEHNLSDHRLPGWEKNAAADTAGQRVVFLGLHEAVGTALRYIDDADSAEANKSRLYLVGTGVGAPEAGTEEAQEAIAEAQVLFGAKTVLENLRKTWEIPAAKTCVPIYDSGEILQYLKEHQEIGTAAVAYSGDSGFFSGAASMLEMLQKDGKGGTGAWSDVRVICGISCVSWFAAKAGIPWQNWKLLSSHGRFCNVTGQVRRNRECFLLLSGAEDLRRTGKMLADAQERGVLGALRLICGYELSRQEEEIRECAVRELSETVKEGLYVLYIRHDDADRIPVLPGLPDSAFVRGKAPMTSVEIRALSLCRLGLTAKAVLWDVGAGTGSVSVEAALTCPEGKVYSVECKEEALTLLEENRERYCLQNMEITAGRAPAALADLPAPTHVFIGGSGGAIGEILRVVFGKNPEAKVVVNAITAETLTALHTALEEMKVRGLQCTQVIVNREEKLGRYHYLRAGNPVFIISFSGTETRACSGVRGSFYGSTLSEIM